MSEKKNTQEEEVVEYKGTPIIKSELEVLQEFVKITGKEFKIYDDVQKDYLKGIEIRDNRVKALSLRKPEFSEFASMAELMKAGGKRQENKKARLIHLPESIGNLTSLKKLYLNENHLKTLPDTIGTLSSLKELYLNNNNLTSLPESLENLSKLERLSLEGNNLKNLPDSIGKLHNLKVLLLKENQLEGLPETIGGLSSIVQISLDNNKLKKLPDSIGNLLTLEYLELKENDLTEIPDSIGKLINLRSLNLWHNKLIKLPETLGRFKKIDLNLKYNLIRKFPEAIEKLDKLEGCSVYRDTLEELEKRLKAEKIPDPFIKTLKHQKDVINLIDFSYDGKYLASGSFDGTLNIWDTETWEVVKTFDYPGEYSGTFAWSPINYEIITRSTEMLKIYNILEDTEKEIKLETYNHNSPNCIKWSKDGKFLAIGSDNATLEVFDLDNNKTKKYWMVESQGLPGMGEEFRKWEHEERAPLDWSPDGKYIVSASLFQVRIFNTEGEQIRSFGNFNSQIFAISWSPDGKYIATGSKDFELIIWDPSSGEQVYQVKFSPAWREYDDFNPNDQARFVNTISWSPDSKYFVIGDDEDNLTLFRIHDEKVNIAGLGDHSTYVYCVSWGKDGKYIASSSGKADKWIDRTRSPSDEDNSIKIWSAEVAKSQFLLS